MQAKDKVIAIACADIHLSQRAPLARLDDNWFDAMARPLNELRELAYRYDVPILCAGDIFDGWRPPPEIINFALEYLPNGMITIPGQHDLPLHNLDDVEKSAYWTLVKAGKILGLTKDNGDTTMISGTDIRVRGFPWGVKVAPTGMQHLRIALIHAYCWIPGHSYPNAPQEAKLTKSKASDLKGFSVAVFGDNHKGFLTKCGDTTVLNCGTLMRRKVDEIDYKPHVGLIHESGRVTLHYLNTDQDVMVNHEVPIDPSVDMDDFLNEVADLQYAVLDFSEAIRQAIEKRKPSPAVRQALLKAMEQ